MKIKICVSCGKKFSLTEKEIDFYKSKKFDLPKRCEECRKERRELKKQKNKSALVRCIEWLYTRNNSLENAQNAFKYNFRNIEELKEHFIKHGWECNCKTPKKYLKIANEIIKSKKSLRKNEKDDGDIIYFNKKTGGIVFLSPKGYIRSFYIVDIDYFNRQ